MAYPANLAVTYWGSLQSGNTADLETNFRNLQVGLNGIGNGASALSSVAISDASIGQSNVGGINGNSAVFQSLSLQSPLPIGSGGSNQTTFANSSVVVITAGSMTGVLPIANGTVLMSNGTAWGPNTIPSSASTNPSPQSNSLSGNVSLNNTSTYFDGPSVNVGGIGTWFVSGTVTCKDTTTANFAAKLWDGTTILASTFGQGASGVSVPLPLSGFITSPAGPLKISVQDQTNTTGQI